MKKFFSLLLALTLVSFLPLNAQDAPHSGEDTPLNKEEGQETPEATSEELAEFAALEEATIEVDTEEKAKASNAETEKKTACINISPSEQKANSKEEPKKSKGATKENLNKSPKCNKLKQKEQEASKKKPKASSRVKLVSYRPGAY